MKFLRYKLVKFYIFFTIDFGIFESFLTGEEIDKSASSGENFVTATIF